MLDDSSLKRFLKTSFQFLFMTLSGWSVWQKWCACWHSQFSCSKQFSFSFENITGVCSCSWTSSFGYFVDLHVFHLLPFSMKMKYRNENFWFLVKICYLSKLEGTLKDLLDSSTCRRGILVLNRERFYNKTQINKEKKLLMRKTQWKVAQSSGLYSIFNKEPLTCGEMKDKVLGSQEWETGRCLYGRTL